MSHARQVKQIGDDLSYRCDHCRKWFTAESPNLKPPRSADLIFDTGGATYGLYWFCSLNCVSEWTQKKLHRGKKEIAT